MATSSAATPEVALQYLIDSNIAVKRSIKWGNHYRQVIDIKGKMIQYNGVRINKTLEKIILPLYIDSTMSSKENTKETTKKVLKSVFTNLSRNEKAKVIQKAFKTTLKLDASDVSKAFQGKTKSITVRPTKIGSIIATDIEYILYNAFLKAKKEIPSDANYSTYGQCKFEAIDAEGTRKDINVTTTPRNKKKEPLMWADLRDRIIGQLQSDTTIDPYTLKFIFHFMIIPKGGASTTSRDKLSIYNKTSVNKVVNEDNNCFWYALLPLVYPKHPKLKQIKMGRPIRKLLAMELCSHCDMEWDKQVSFDDIDKVERALNVNIMIFDIDNIPMLKTTSSIYNSLMYKNSEVKTPTQYYLLYDNEHYHSINNVKGFLAVDYFCPCCLQGFNNKKAYMTHQCVDCEEGVFTKRRKKQVKSNKIGKDITQYLHSKEMKGGKDEVEFKIQQVIKMAEKNGDDVNAEYFKNYIERKRADYTNTIEHPRYIVYDFEADVHTGEHKPNHVEADYLIIGDTHNYSDCLVDQFSYSGYDAASKFCDWLFQDKHNHTTVIAHNQAGYDGKFILQWCLKKGVQPQKYIRQGSRIMYMEFVKHHIRFVDSLHFFLEPLKNLSSTYNIDTIKGFFPHMFNTPENQNYIGTIPKEDDFGANNLSTKAYDKEFKPWYDEQAKRTDWNFKEEMIKYCRADTELLSKSVLVFRKMFKDKLDIDPFRYVTLASLCMAIFRGCFLPKKSIVANEQNKPVSKVSKEWLMYLNDDKLVPEKPVFIEKDKLTYTEDQLHKGKLDGDTATYYNQNTHLFTPDAICTKRKIIKEFNGCYFHGCPKCNPECKLKYNRTMERKNLLEIAGYKVDMIWNCEWDKLKSTLPNKAELEEKADKQNIKPRHALFGGRTEAFKSHVKCNKHQKIFYLDVVSLYPTVNALDDYAVGFRKYVDITVDDILNDKFIGLVKCDVEPPKDLYIPVLPDNDKGKLLFHLNPMYEKTWASVELKLALQKGYKITKIHSATEYKRYNGLMKDYVGCFIKMKIENTEVLNQKECDEVNAYHKRLGFDFEIKPENTIKNPGLRQVAKICLNSLWGKFGQRTGMDDYDFYFDYNKLINAFVNNNKIVPQTWNVIDAGCVELRYTEDQEMTIESDYISEITAVFTTANARCRLYKMMDWLHDTQMIYCDTDSVIFMYDEENPNHKNPYIHEPPKGLEFGKGLGQWEDEFDGKDWIEEIVTGGAKSYSYRTALGATKKGKVVCKQKGITLDKANDKKINFDTMKNMVLNNEPMQSEKRFTFKWETTSKNIVTDYIARSVKSTIGEKRCIVGYDTTPIGFEDNL